MKIKVTLVTVIVFCSTLISGFSQQVSSWEKWTWLIGEWQGEGTGKPGQGGGTFSFKPDLDGQVLVSKSHSEYPAENNKPAIVHDDLMVVYRDDNGDPSNAIYFDNEGHTNNYSIIYADKSVILTSKKTQHAPVFRLSNILIDKDLVDVKFEMSQDGENFDTYTEGKSRKMK